VVVLALNEVEDVRIKPLVKNLPSGIIPIATALYKLLFGELRSLSGTQITHTVDHTLAKDKKIAARLPFLDILYSKRNVIAKYKIGKFAGNFLNKHYQPI
jgi:hypothetical protein